MAGQRTATQGEGIDKLSIAMAMRRMGMKRDAEEKQRCSKELRRRARAEHRKAEDEHSTDEQGKGRAKNSEDLCRKARA